jgi:hypothetical protein
MGTKEHCQAVADYLKVAGCDSVDGIFLGIGGVGVGASKAGVRAALKKLGAWGRKTGAWRCSVEERESAEKRLEEAGRHFYYCDLHFPGVVTLYKLGPWASAW